MCVYFESSALWQSVVPYKRCFLLPSQLRSEDDAVNLRRVGDMDCIHPEPRSPAENTNRETDLFKGNHKKKIN